MGAPHEKIDSLPWAHIPEPKVLRCDQCGEKYHGSYIQNGSWHPGCSYSPAGRLRSKEGILGEVRNRF